GESTDDHAYTPRANSCASLRKGLRLLALLVAPWTGGGFWRIAHGAGRGKRRLQRENVQARCLRALFLRALAIRHSSPPRLRRKPNRRRQSGEVPRPAGPVPGVWLPPGGPLRPGRVEAPRGHRRARAGQARRLRASGWRNGTAGSRRRRAAAGASGSRGGEGLRG
ncbi:unnamed protein product, partial [Prorocentrum cordatum]